MKLNIQITILPFGMTQSTQSGQIEDPTVSVVIGMYNEERYISECIESLLEQDFKDFEIIIIDDCSTDSSYEIVSKFHDERIRLLRNRENIGLTRSLNRGINIAKGRYIARQDADDLSAPSRLKEQVSYLEQNEDVAMVGTGAYLIDERGDIIHERIVPNTVSYDSLMEKNQIIHGSILARKYVFQSVEGYDQLFQYSQDLDMWLRISKDYPIRNIPNPYYFLRIHDKSVYISSNTESLLYSQLALAKSTDGLSDQLVDEIQSKGIRAFYQHLSDKQRRNFHESLAIRYLRYGKMNMARNQCIRAIKEDPWTIKAYILILLSYSGRTFINHVNNAVRFWLNYWNQINNYVNRLQRILI